MYLIYKHYTSLLGKTKSMNIITIDNNITHSLNWVVFSHSLQQIMQCTNFASRSNQFKTDLEKVPLPIVEVVEEKKKSQSWVSASKEALLV